MSEGEDVGQVSVVEEGVVGRVCGGNAHGVLVPCMS